MNSPRAIDCVGQEIHKGDMVLAVSYGDSRVETLVGPVADMDEWTVTLNTIRNSKEFKRHFPFPSIIKLSDRQIASYKESLLSEKG